MERERHRVARRIADAGGGLGGGGGPTGDDPLTEPCTFDTGVITTMMSCPVDYAAADKRWYAAYSCYVSQETRQFLICLAEFISTHNYQDEEQLYIVRCTKFYKRYYSPFRDSVSPEALAARIRIYAEDELISHKIHRKANYIWFVSSQKEKLLKAALPPMTSPAFPMVNGRPISPPAM